MFLIVLMGRYSRQLRVGSNAAGLGHRQTRFAVMVTTVLAATVGTAMTPLEALR